LTHAPTIHPPHWHNARMRTSAATRLGFFQRARGLAETLAWLRLVAIAGQALTVAVVVLGLGLPIPVVPLALGIGALGLFALFAFWRLEQPWPVSLAEAFGHVAVDIFVLAYLLYWTGGVDNPFVSLLVIPMALAAAALSLRYVVAVALLASTCFVALMVWHEPLPLLHGARFAAMDLHVAAVSVNFVLTAAVLAFFIARLARALRAREAEVRHERERTLRDEGILAIATQAAGTAHELNTPLSTIRTLLGELQRERAGDPPLAADLALLVGQAERCRDILRQLVEVGSRRLAGTPERLPLATFVDACENQFRLLRPEISLAITFEGDAGARAIEAVPDLGHALINLLSNAGDASLAAGSAAIELHVAATNRHAEFAVRDHGAGIAPGGGAAFKTSKAHGLGLGLALAHSTAERLGGELTAHAADGGGLLQRLRIPLPANDNRPR
jgi:two-component system sensor histidine kinase RegB